MSQPQMVLRDEQEAGDERLRDFLELASDWFWELDENLRFVDFRGRPPLHPAEELVGKTRWEVHRADPTASPWRDHVAVLQARQPFRNFEHPTWSPDGRTVWISVSGRPLFDREGRFLGYRGVSSDITDRKRAEERLGLALEAGRIVAWERDLATGQVTRSQNAEWVYGAAPRDAAWFLNSVHPEDRELHERLIADAVATEGSYEIEFRFIRPDGETIWLTTRAEVKTGRDGSRRLFGITSDITARKRAELLALENAALLNATLGNMDQGLIMVDGEGILQVCNRRAVEMLDLPAHYATSKPSFSDFIAHQASIGEFAGATEQNAPWLKLRGNLLSAPPLYERTRPNGTVLEIRTVHLADGGAVRTFTDITARRRAEVELRQSEERYRALVAATAAIFWRAAPDGLITEVIGWDTYSGQDPAGYTGHGWLASVHPHDRAHAEAEWRTAVAAGRLSDIEYRVRRADGTYRWVSDRGAPIRNPDGSVREWVGTVTDIHERRVAQEELARREEQYRALIRASASIVWRADASGAILEDVVGWDTLTGQPPEGHRGRGWLDMVHPDDLSNVVQVWDHLLAEGEPGENEFRVKQGEGPYRWVSTRAVPLKNPDGSIREWVGTMTDIHTRKESEARLRQSREELQAALDANRVLLENSLDVICTIDSTGVFLQVSPHAVNVWGYTPEELAGQAFYELVHPEDREKTRLAFLSVIGGTPTSAFENRYMRKDGSVVPILWSAIWSEQHKTMFCVARDLSERLRTEEQLRQSQKMEAVGQLTGGVAHDFNNLLTVILGNAEVLLDDPANPALTRTLAQMILDAAERGAELTQHLLAFGRRQSLKPVQVSLDHVVRGMTPLLRRTLGEHIELETRPSHSLFAALTDRTLLESAILNLAVNAKDAMPQGGTLTILTGEGVAGPGEGALVPGQSVVFLTVSDTGTGMSPEVLSRAFEPFFTTKEVGRGSGLGLSMVYGFAQQSGGMSRSRAGWARARP